MAASLTGSCDLTQCSKCHQLLKSPRSLPCLHSYCTSCLEELTKGTKKVKCVECGEEYDLPPGGLEEWQPLAIIQRMTEQKAMQTALMTEETIHCTACVDDKEERNDRSDQPVAVARCTECDDYLCKRCVDIHKSQRSLKNHPVFTLDELRRGKVPKTNAIEQKICLKHKGEVLLFYCETCDVPICRQCVVVAHSYPDHKHAELDQIAKKKNEELQQLQESCKKNEDEANKALQEIRKVKRDFDQAVSEVGNQIKNKVDKLKKRLDEAQKASEEELATVKEKGHQVIKAADHQLTSIIARVSSAKMITKSLRESGSEFEAASDYRNVKAVLQEVEKANPSSIIRQGKNLTDVKFQENTNESTENVVLGKIHSFDTSTSSRSKREVLKGGALKMEFGSGKLSNARGVTITSSGVIAVTAATKVNIFDSKGAFKSAFNINVGVDAGQSSTTHDIQVGPDNMFYVTDQSSPYVKIFDLQGAYTRHFHTVSPDKVPYNTHGSSKLAGLAINSHHQVLVGNISHNFVSCHSLDGTHVRSMKVTVPPYYLAVTSKGNIVVSPYSQQTGVHIIDETGNVLSQLETPQGASVWQSIGVVVSKIYCVDDDDDELLVADYNNGCAVYRYSTSGKYIGCVTKNISSPYGIALSLDENELFVAHRSLVKCIEI